MRKTHFLICIVALTSSTGCMFSPGQNMSTSKLIRSNDARDNHFQLVPITPKLIAMDHAVDENAALPEELLSYRPEPYRIGAGDTLYITVWDHPELTSPAGSQQATLANGRLVRSDGTLFYPYVGELKVSGMTLEELRQVITEKLTKYIEKPQVDVNMVGYGSQLLTLKGAFLKTTPQPFTAIPLTLNQAIGSAQVDSEQADTSSLVLTRDGKNYTIDLNEAGKRNDPFPDIYLKPGDKIYLPFNDHHQVYVVGEVVRPLAITYRTTDLSLTDVLGRVGGLSQTTAKGKAVYVIRGVKDMEKSPATIYQLNAHSPTAFALADNFIIKPGDVVFVGAAGITRWNRFLSQLLPMTSFINSAVSSQYQLNRE